MKHVDYLALGIRLIVIWNLVVAGMQSIIQITTLAYYEIRTKFVEDLSHTYQDLWFDSTAIYVTQLLLNIVFAVIVMRYADRIASLIVDFAKPRQSDETHSD